MEETTALKIQELLNRRDKLHSQYTRTCSERYISIPEHGEEVYKDVNLALWKAINKIDEELNNI